MTTTRRMLLGLGLPAALVGCWFALATSTGSCRWLGSWQPDWLDRSPPPLRGDVETIDWWIDETTLDGVAVDTAPLARFVSDNGSTCVVLSEWDSTYHGRAVARPRYVVAQRPPSAPPVEEWEPYVRPALTETLADWLGVEDRILAEGVLPWATALVDVLDDGDLVLVHPTVDQLDIVARHGQRPWRATGRDIFGAEYAAAFADHTDTGYLFRSCPPWLSVGWVDAATGTYAIIDWKDRVVALDLSTGRPCQVDDRTGLALAGLRLPGARPADAILDLAIREHLDSAVEPARGLLADTTRPLTTRLRAAIVLADHGDVSGRDLILVVSRAPAELGENNGPDVARAWAWLGSVLGDEALELYVTTLKDGWQGGPSDAVDGSIRGLAAFGLSVVDEMLDLVLAYPMDRTGFYRTGKLLSRVRDATPRDNPRSDEFERGNSHQVDRWNAFVDGDAQALHELLARRPFGGPSGDWSTLVLPALRHIRREPQPQFAEPLRDFLAAWDGGPRAIPAWTAFVRAEAEAALSAVEAAR